MSVRPSSSQENPSLSDPRTREWETKARTWLSSMPSNHVVSTDEMDGWIDSDLPSLPEDLKSLPRSHLHRRILSLLDLIRRSSNQEGAVNQIEPPCPPRFQRTDQWKPVYTWLESLETNEVVTHDEIVDWLSKNLKIREQLYSKHSRHHLKHYIQRCHLKMLRRRDKSRKALQGIQAMQPHTTRTPANVKNAMTMLAIRHPCNLEIFSVTEVNSASSLAKFQTIRQKNAICLRLKKTEASLRYELLTDLHNELTGLLSRQKQSDDLKESGSVSIIGQISAENANCHLSIGANEGNV